MTHSGYRTFKQKDADQLDLEMDRLVAKMERFASVHKEASVDKAAGVVFGLRNVVRAHMHEKDREKSK